jgi:hypothetical protein
VLFRGQDHQRCSCKIMLDILHFSHSVSYHYWQRYRGCDVATHTMVRQPIPDQRSHQKVHFSYPEPQVQVMKIYVDQETLLPCLGLAKDMLPDTEVCVDEENPIRLANSYTNHRDNARNHFEMPGYLKSKTSARSRPRCATRSSTSSKRVSHALSLPHSQSQVVSILVLHILRNPKHSRARQSSAHSHPSPTGKRT